MFKQTTAQFGGILGAFMLSASAAMGATPAQNLPQPQDGQRSRIVPKDDCRYYYQIYEVKKVTLKDAQGNAVKKDGKTVKQSQDKIISEQFANNDINQACVADRQHRYDMDFNAQNNKTLASASTTMIISSLAQVQNDPSIAAEQKSAYADELLKRIIAMTPQDRQATGQQMSDAHLDIQSVLTFRAMQLISSYKQAVTPEALIKTPELQEAAGQEIIAFTNMPGFGDAPRAIMDAQLKANGYVQGLQDFAGKADPFVCGDDENGDFNCKRASQLPSAQPELGHP